jgi:hypothetical protein
LRLYTAYLTCKYQDEIDFNQNKWTGAFVTFFLNGMFGGEKDNFEKWSNSLGMFSHKKKTVIHIDKEKEISKANSVFEEMFLSNKWDDPNTVTEGLNG